MNKKQVGQVLYILSQQDMSLVPVLIVEEVVRRTLDDEQITYIVEAIGQNGVKKRFNLNQERYQVFDDVLGAKDHLIKNATDAISSLCEVASRKAHDLLEKSKVMTARPHADIEKNIDDFPVRDFNEVLLEDGTVAKIKLQ